MLSDRQQAEQFWTHYFQTSATWSLRVGFGELLVWSIRSQCQNRRTWIKMMEPRVLPPRRKLDGGTLPMHFRSFDQNFFAPMVAAGHWKHGLARSVSVATVALQMYWTVFANTWPSLARGRRVSQVVLKCATYNFNQQLKPTWISEELSWHNLKTNHRKTGTCGKLQQKTASRVALHVWDSFREKHGRDLKQPITGAQRNRNTNKRFWDSCSFYLKAIVPLLLLVLSWTKKYKSQKILAGSWRTLFGGLDKYYVNIWEYFMDV